MSAAKRMKREYYDEVEARANRESSYENETQEALEEIDACQNLIDELNEKASEHILKVELKYNKLRKPFFEKRNQVIQKIENFWVTAFVNHPQITSLLDEDEEDCLHNLSKLEVEEFEDIKLGYRIKFFFEPNQYFENDVLTKEFHFGSPVPFSKSTPIRWKEGQNLVQMIKERNQRNQRQGKRRKPENRTFFTWYEEDCDSTADEIAEVIKDDLWPNPLQYYLTPDIEVDINGVEDDGEDDDVSEEDGDELVVIVDDDMEEGTNEEEDDEIIVDEDDSLDGSLKSKSDCGSTGPPIEITNADSPTKDSLTSETSSPTKDPLGTDNSSPIKDPLATDTSSPTKDPPATDTSSPTKDPLATDTSSLTEDPLATDTASPTKNPLATDTSSPTKDPVGTDSSSPTKDPLATDTSSPTKAPLPSETCSPVKDPIFKEPATSSVGESAE